MLFTVVRLAQVGRRSLPTRVTKWVSDRDDEQHETETPSRREARAVSARSSF